MWFHLIYVPVISFFVTRKCQKTQKIDENSSYGTRKSSYLLNDLRNFNKIFRKDVTYDNIKSTVSLKSAFFENPQGVESNRPPCPSSPPLPAFLGLIIDLHLYWNRKPSQALKLLKFPEEAFLFDNWKLCFRVNLISQRCIQNPAKYLKSSVLRK